jgi:cell division protein ZapA
VSDVPVVYIEVHGQRYPIRTRLEPPYVQDLARYVDRKMHAAAEASPSSDGVGLAVLTALNIADEFFRSRNERSDEAASLSSRAEELERIVDQALQSAGLSLILQEEDGVDGGGAPSRPPNGGKSADAEGEPRP